MDPENLLKELVQAIAPLTVNGRPIKQLDTRLRQAVFDAEKYFFQKGIHLK